MKRIALKSILALFITLFFVISTAAQEIKSDKKPSGVKNTAAKDKIKNYDASLRRWEFGVRYNPTFSRLNLRNYDQEVSKSTFATSHGFGVNLGYNFNKTIGLQGEINYYHLSLRQLDRNIYQRIKLTYLDIPILISLNTSKYRAVNINAVLGPQFGITVGSKLETPGNASTDTLHAIVKVKRGDFGLAYGAGCEIALNYNHTWRLDFGFRGYFSFIKMSDDSRTNDTYNVIAKSNRQAYGAYLARDILLIIFNLLFADGLAFTYKVNV